jgi:hypothetical protein
VVGDGIKSPLIGERATTMTQLHDDDGRAISDDDNREKTGAHRERSIFHRHADKTFFGVPKDYNQDPEIRDR